VDRAALDAAADGGPPVESTVYGTADGMRSRECNGANSPPAWRGRDGRLWFPTGRGVVAVDPSRLPRNTVPPPVTIEEILVDGAAAAAHVFPAGAKNLEIRYTAASFTEASRVRFKVKLEGYDRDWVDAGPRRAAYYTHLPPGDYVFRVQAANDAGVWNEEGAAAALRFEPAFTQTPWFWLVLAAAASGLGALFVRDWLSRRVAREAELVALVAERTRQLEEANRGLRLLSTTDALTGIANRRSFDDTLRLFWTQARRSGAAISILIIDCDDFKGYNDAYGHLQGDACLKSVAEALVAAVSRTGDIVARFGGEEFAVLLLETPLEGCERVAERMRAAVERLGLASAASATGRVTVSVGGATAYPGAGLSSDALIEKADALLYRAKRAGKNRIFVAREPLGTPGPRAEGDAAT
jgi:diguanylate cyclase (GGDEF)-like protein